MKLGDHELGPEEIYVDLPNNRMAVGWMSHSVHLSPREAELALVLVSAMPRLQHNEEIIARVWGATPGESITSRCLKVHIHHLRNRIRGFGLAVENIWDRGYRIVRAEHVTVIAERIRKVARG